MRALRVESEGIEDVNEFLKSIELLESGEGMSVLALDEDAVFGEDQIRAAVMHAERNFSKGKKIL